MAIAFSGAAEVVNTAGLGGNQNNAQVAHFANGGYVVAWTTDLGGQKDVLFQLYDGAGNQVGGPTLANTGVTAGDQVLTDMIATDNGHFVLSFTDGATVVARSFDALTGAQTGSNTVTTTGTAATGAQLLAVAAAQFTVVTSGVSGANSTVDKATFNTAGGTVSAATNVTSTLAAGISILELVDGNAAGDRFALLNNGSLLSTTSATVSASTGTDVRDVIKLQNGLHVAEGEIGSSTFTAIAGVSGTGTDLTTYTVGTPSPFTSVSGASGTGLDDFGKVLLDLGDGRLLTFFVSDTGTSATTPDGLFAAVTNIFTGVLETGATSVDPVGDNVTPASLQAVSISADLLADGRVAVAWSDLNKISGADVFTRIVDARVAPVTVAGTAGADIFVGTNLVGDTVSYAASAAGIVIDLANNAVNTGDAAANSLSGFENVTGTASADQIYGNSSANVLLGGAGDDRLFGRDGADTISGDAGDDTANGGAGDDLLKGLANNDSLHGGAGNDTLDGGDNNDTLSGGDGNDTLLGGTGNDRLHGGNGDDQMDGGSGNNFLAGDGGDDLILAGNGNDTINGGDGNDTIDGGSGNDTIAGGAGFNVIDGGAGTDTVSYANVLVPAGFNGFYVDLDGAADPVGSMDGFSADDDQISNVENIVGSSGADYLAGNASANLLRGGDGDDFLFGRAGADTLIGGAGNDTVIFENTTAGVDKIKEFAHNGDKLEFVSANFGDIDAGNIGASFVSNAAGTATIAGPQFVFDNAGAGAGSLFFDADGTGAGAAIQLASMTFGDAAGLSSFSAADFKFV